jgi:RNA polymerase sigma-70 factor (ECF subfamily)
MREPSDEDLMRAYARGDVQAFERLYARHRGPLYRYVLRLAGDAATANDLFQGSWEKIIRARRQYRPSSPFKAWMYRIAHNHAMDCFRRSRPASGTAPEDCPTDAPGPEQRFLDENRQADLFTAVQDLPPEQREALLLKLEAGLDTRTIAEVTGVKPETAKSRLRYAVSRLQRSLGE